jgi:hypothetical protein
LEGNDLNAHLKDNNLKAQSKGVKGQTTHYLKDEGSEVNL